MAALHAAICLALVSAGCTSQSYGTYTPPAAHADTVRNRVGYIEHMSACVMLEGLQGPLAAMPIPIHATSTANRTVADGLLSRFSTSGRVHLSALQNGVYTYMPAFEVVRQNFVPKDTTPLPSDTRVIAMEISRADYVTVSGREFGRVRFGQVQLGMGSDYSFNSFALNLSLQRYASQTVDYTITIELSVRQFEKDMNSRYQNGDTGIAFDISHRDIEGTQLFQEYGIKIGILTVMSRELGFDFDQRCRYRSVPQQQADFRAWSRFSRVLRQTEGPTLAHRLQAVLRNMGCYDGPVNGVWGPRSRSGFASFVNAARQTGLDRCNSAFFGTSSYRYPGTY